MVNVLVFLIVLKWCTPCTRLNHTIWFKLLVKTLLQFYQWLVSKWCITPLKFLMNFENKLDQVQIQMLLVWTRCKLLFVVLFWITGAYSFSWWRLNIKITYENENTTLVDIKCTLCNIYSSETIKNIMQHSAHRSYK